MAYTPLITTSDLTDTPLSDTFSAFSPSALTNLCIRSSRTVESYCKRRLTPFTGLVETHTARMLDMDDNPEPYIPLDTTSALGLSRAQSLNATTLVRNVMVDHYPALWPDLWTGSVSAVTLYRTFGGSASVDPTNPAFEFHADTGRIVMPLGTYCPMGTRVVVTYSGGYSTIPDELKQAAVYQAVEFAILDLEPSSRPDIEVADLRAAIAKMLSEYVRAA